MVSIDSYCPVMDEKDHPGELGGQVQSEFNGAHNSIAVSHEVSSMALVENPS